MFFAIIIVILLLSIFISKWLLFGEQKSPRCWETADFKRSLECQYGLLDILIQNGCLTTEVVNDLKQRYRTDRERNSKLVSLINSSNVDQFVEGLQLSNQSHLANFLRKNGIKESPEDDDWPVTESYIAPVIKVYPQLVKEIHKSVLDHLFGRNCLSDEQKSAIQSKSTEAEINRELLDIMMRRSVRQLEEFFDCLKEDHKHIWLQISKSRGKDLFALDCSSISDNLSINISNTILKKRRDETKGLVEDDDLELELISVEDRLYFSAKAEECTRDPISGLHSPSINALRKINDIVNEVLENDKRQLVDIRHVEHISRGDYANYDQNTTGIQCQRKEYHSNKSTIHNVSEQEKQHNQDNSLNRAPANNLDSSEGLRHRQAGSGSRRESEVKKSSKFQNNPELSAHSGTKNYRSNSSPNPVNLNDRNSSPNTASQHSDGTAEKPFSQDKITEENYGKMVSRKSSERAKLLTRPDCLVNTLPHNIRITGLTVIHDILFLVRENQSQVKVYDSNSLRPFRIINIPDMKRPQGLTGCAYNKTLYISDPGLESIHRVDLSNNSVTRWQISENHEPLGLSVTAEHTLLVTVGISGARGESEVYTGESGVVEYTSEGQQIREIRFDRSIDWAWHTVQLSSNQFIVSHGLYSSSLNRVCVVNAEGQIIKIFGRGRGRGEDQLREPHSLAIDEKSKNIFVADQFNSRVLMFDSELSYLGEVHVSRDLTGPWRLYFDSSTDRLFVTEDSGRLYVVHTPGDSRFRVTSSL